MVFKIKKAVRTKPTNVDPSIHISDRGEVAIVTSRNLEISKSLGKYLSETFEVKNQGDVEYRLGIEFV